MVDNARKHWTSEQDDFLYEFGATRDLKWLSKQLERTEDAIQRRIERLGICHKHSYSGTYSANELAQMLGVDSKTIINWINKNGLYAQQGSYFKEGARQTKYKTKAEPNKPWFIHLDDFWKWAKENTQRVNFSRFDLGVFPNEPEWVHIERKKHAKLPKTKTLWTDEESNEAWRLYYSGYTQKEIAERLKRSVSAVEKRLKRLREMKKKELVR